MESIDDLLSQLKAQYKPAPPAADSPPTAQPETSLPNPSPSAEGNTGNVDGLLAQLQAEFVASPPAANLPANLPVAASDLPLLTELKAEYVQKDRLEAEKRQQQEEAERLERERQRQKQRDALRQEAQAWLKKLDRFSGEGLWFRDFAKDYPSEVEAAIDYLEAMKEL
jgi:hypothetical protein